MQSAIAKIRLVVTCFYTIVSCDRRSHNICLRADIGGSKTASLVTDVEHLCITCLPFLTVNRKRYMYLVDLLGRWVILNAGTRVVKSPVRSCVECQQAD